MDKAIDFYIQEKKAKEKSLQQIKKEISQIGYLRLADFIIGLTVSIYTYYIHKFWLCAYVSILWIGIFIYLVKLHERIIENRSFVEKLIYINEKGIKRIKGEWKSFDEDGNEFAEQEHPYSGDLDVFGRSSLFQWINSTATYMGNLKLAEYLKSPMKTIKNILTRQEAVKELSKEVQWRQKVNAKAMLIKEQSKDPEKLIVWAENKSDIKDDFFIKFVMNVVPIINITFVLLAIFTNFFSSKYLLGIIALDMIILKFCNGGRNEVLDTIHKYKNGIRLYEKVIRDIEKEDFKASYLRELNMRLTFQGKRASQAIGELKAISDFVSDRYNMAYIVFDILFMWDFRCFSMLEKWKNKYGSQLKSWLEAVGEIEALYSLANIAFENKNWAFPDIYEKGNVVRAEELGHPLLGDKRVCNDITIEGNGSVVLITGSNMSGKSTFLRTIGINLVLTYCGAPVCAKEFGTIIMDIYTCMRISDNLEKSISSFYAEILRIKTIVNEAKENKRVFFLLDEIFKGTNSIDRHLGAEALIKQLSSQGASGLVSTHDLELGEMEKEMEKLTNFHFQEYYENDELHFDYKLRRGVSTTRNAIYIIKMAGIDIKQ